jgi:hypothetical protein
MKEKEKERESEKERNKRVGRECKGTKKSHGGNDNQCNDKHFLPPNSITHYSKENLSTNCTYNEYVQSI